MSKKNKPIPAGVPAVINIITDKSSQFVSATMTRRDTYSPLEKSLCDWDMQVSAAGVTCYVVGRGDRIDQRRVVELCEAVLRLNQAFPQVSALTLPKKDAAFGQEREVDDPGLDFENDPFWQRIKAVAGGAR